MDTQKLNELVYSKFYDKASGLTAWLIKVSGGLIKTKSQANVVLIAVSIVFLIIAGFLFYQLFGVAPAVTNLGI